MDKATERGQNLLVHTLVTFLDKAGLSGQVSAHIGPEGTRNLMKAYDKHEATEKRRR